MVKLLLLAGMFAVVQGDIQSDRPKNTIVTTRLIAFHPEFAKGNVDSFRRSGWYKEIKDSGYFQPTNEQILKIDLELGDYLANVVAKSRSSKTLPNFSEGIKRIRAIRHFYGGQFMGATRADGRKIIICMYSMVEDIDNFQALDHVPYVSDGDGLNFQFYYDVTTGDKTDFHIEGNFGGPFGS